MKRYIAIFAPMFVGASALGATAREYVLNYKRIDSGKVAITCANGGDPTGTKVGDVLVIDCGK